MCSSAASLKSASITQERRSKWNKVMPNFLSKTGDSLGKAACALVFMVIQQIQNKIALKSAVSFQT